MLARLLTAAAIFATPAYAFAGDIPKNEVRIRNMADYLEAVVDDRRGVYIRGYTGQWYYARVRGECSRLQRGARLRFDPSPGGDFDRESTIRADGFHCFVDSVTESEGPPNARRG